TCSGTAWLAVKPAPVAVKVMTESPAAAAAVALRSIRASAVPGAKVTSGAVTPDGSPLTWSATLPPKPSFRLNLTGRLEAEPCCKETEGAPATMANGSTTVSTSGAVASTVQSKEQGSVPNVPASMFTAAGPPRVAPATACRVSTPVDDSVSRKNGSAVMPAGSPDAETGNASVRKEPVRWTSTTTRRVVPAAMVRSLGSSDVTRTRFSSTVSLRGALAVTEPLVAITVKEAVPVGAFAAAVNWRPPNVPPAGNSGAAATAPASRPETTISL